MKTLTLSAVLFTAIFLFSCSNSDDNNSTQTDATTVSGDSSNAYRDTGSSHSGTAAMTDSMGNSTSANNNNNTGTATVVTDRDVVQFVQKANGGGMMEVEMGKLAASNAQSDRVKSYGQMLVNDHSAALNDLRSMAGRNGITVSTAMMPEHQGHIDMLKNKSGASFDKAYMDMMVKDHVKDIMDFKKASGNLKDSSYAMFARKTLPVLQKHLDSAKAIVKK